MDADTLLQRFRNARRMGSLGFHVLSETPLRGRLPVSPKSGTDEQGESENRMKTYLIEFYDGDSVDAMLYGKKHYRIAVAADVDGLDDLLSPLHCAIDDNMADTGDTKERWCITCQDDKLAQAFEI